MNSNLNAAAPIIALLAYALIVSGASWLRKLWLRIPKRFCIFCRH